MEEQLTKRQAIVEMLKETTLSAEDLAALFKVTVKEILLDLEHIQRSIRPKRFHITPASCHGCGFVFNERRRLSTPSRCPKCKGERIAPPFLHIP